MCARIAFEDGSNASTVVTLRCAFAMLAIGAAIRVSATPDAMTGRDRRLILVLGLFFAVNVYAFYKAVELLRVPLAILIFYVYPLLTVLFSAAAGLERLRGAVIACCLVSLAGLALATGAAPEAVDALGVALVLCSAAVIAAVLVVTTRRVAHVDARRRTFWMMVSTTAVLGTGLVASGTFTPPESARGLAALAGVCVFYSIGLVALFTSATRIGPARTAVIMNLEPVAAILLSTLLLGQGLTAAQLGGGALALAGVLGAQLAQQARSR
ncbi:MAG: EamA family transporter [Burkholderiales bacterium]|nr:EamA family transporter [Burkholderiales bacterium]